MVCSLLRAPSRSILHCENPTHLPHIQRMDVRSRIQAILDERGLSARSVSLEAGLSDSMLHKFLTSKTQSITVETLEKIAKALGVSLRHLMFGDPDDDKVAYIWDHIPQRDRVRALKLLESFADISSDAAG
jgi:transcriptional regulator with XRE-family HTH domain